MKFTRSFPAKAMANANVPVSTKILKTLILSALSICDTTVETRKQMPQMVHE